MKTTSIRVVTNFTGAGTVQNALANINLAKLTGFSGVLRVQYFSAADIAGVTEQLKAGTNDEPVQSGSAVNNNGAIRVSNEDDHVTTFDTTPGQELFLTVTAGGAGNHMCMLKVTQA